MSRIPLKTAALWLALCLPALSPSSALAQAAPPTAAERYQALPEDQKEELRKKLREFKSLPPGEQARIRENLARWRELSPDARERVRENVRYFNNERMRLYNLLGGPTEAAAEGK